MWVDVLKDIFNEILFTAAICNIFYNSKAIFGTKASDCTTEPTVIILNSKQSSFFWQQVCKMFYILYFSLS